MSAQVLCVAALMIVRKSCRKYASTNSLSNVQLASLCGLQMAELLFGSEPTAARCAAALMLLSTHSLYFKQSGRLPPKYQPRTAETVVAMRAQEERERQARAASWWSSLSPPRAALWSWPSCTFLGFQRLHAQIAVPASIRVWRLCRQRSQLH